MKFFKKGEYLLLMNAMYLMNAFFMAGGGTGTGTGTGTEAATTWSISKFLGALQRTSMYYVQIIILIIGVVMIGVGIYQVAKNLISHGKGQTNWVVTAALIIVGGTLMLGTGWNVIGGIANGSKTTLEKMGQGDIDADASLNTTGENVLSGNGTGTGTSGGGE